MAKYLATLNHFLNDTELTGFNTMTDKEMERFEELASSITWSFMYEVGEDSLYFENGEDLLTRIDFKEISNEEYKVIKKVFNNGFGVFVNEDYLNEIANDESNNSIDDEYGLDDIDYNDRDSGYDDYDDYD
jgi:hypothetical protein